MTDNAKSPILSKNVSSSIGLEPPLRFPGFEGNYVSKKLGDIIIENLTPTPKPDKDYVRIGLYCHSKGIFHEVVPIDKALDVDTMYVVQQDNLIVNITFAWEHAIAITTDRDAGKLVSHRFPTYAFRNGHCHNYYKFAILKKRFRYDLGVASPGGAGRNRVLNKKLFLEIPMIIPSYDEQQKIADFLSLVDERIEKQRQLVEVLKRYKRGLFSSIYSAKQLNWKSVCVGDFSKVYGGYAFDSKTYSESGKYNVLTIGNVSGNRYADIESCNAVEEMPVDIQQYQILQPDDLVVSMTGNVGRVSIVNQDDCLLNQRVAKLDIKDSTIREYVYQVLSCSKFEQEMNNVGQGAAQKNIKNSDIENFIFYIPENNTELNTLARLFLGLDNIILKQEQQLAKLMQSKQSLLQQMFI